MKDKPIGAKRLDQMPRYIRPTLPIDVSLTERIRANSNFTYPKVIPFTGLLTNKILTALPGEDFAQILPHLEPVSLAARHKIYEFDAKVDFVYFPETAVITHIYFLKDGSTTAVALVGNEGLVGLSAILNSHRPAYWSQVTIGGTAVRARPEVIWEQFVRGGAVQRLLLKYTSARLAQLSQKTVCNSRHRLEERFCTWLLMIQDRVSAAHIPLTHEEMAQHLGARRAGITGACNTLRDQGIITYHRGMVSVVDREKLETAACECYRTLKELHVS